LISALQIFPRFWKPQHPYITPNKFQILVFFCRVVSFPMMKILCNSLACGSLFHEIPTLWTQRLIRKIQCKFWIHEIWSALKIKFSIKVIRRYIGRTTLTYCMKQSHDNEVYFQNGLSADSIFSMLVYTYFQFWVWNGMGFDFKIVHLIPVFVWTYNIYMKG